jgi:hypothetical protein
MTGWRRSGTLPLLPLDDSKEIFKEKVQEVIDAVFESGLGGQSPKTDIARALTYSCARIFLEEKCFENIEEFELVEAEIFDMAMLAADDVLSRRKQGERLGRFVDKIFSYHNRRDLYSKIRTILDVDDIPQEYLRKLQDAAHEYHIAMTTHLKNPKESEVEAALLWLANGYRKGFETFRERFKSLDVVTRDRLAMVDFPENLDLMNVDDCEPKRILPLIEKVAESIRKNRAKQKWPAGPRRQLLFRLCEVFYGITGRNPGVTWNEYDEQHSGSFYDFAILLLKEIDSENIQARDPKGLGVRIAEICSQFKKSSQ